MKDRKVTLPILYSSIILGGYLYYSHTFLELYLFSISVNLIFIGFLSLCLWLYIKFKLKLPFFKAIGLGDLLFFLALGVSFPTTTFLIIHTTSLLFALLLFLATKSKMKHKTVPLAGFQALFLVLILLLNLVFEIVNLYTI